MAKGMKELMLYCAENPAFEEELKKLGGKETVKLLREKGYEINHEDFARYAETHEELMEDEELKRTAGGACTGHCGATCEKDCYHIIQDS